MVKLAQALKIWHTDPPEQKQKQQHQQKHKHKHKQ